MIVISLGSSCDTKTNLNRIGINTPTLFFDYVWNELNGLKDVTSIIKSDFRNFDDIINYTKTTTHPILTWDSFNINKYYPMFVFLHHDTSQQCIIDSLNRKIDRTKNALMINEKKVFIYYRHYMCNSKTSTDVTNIIDESIEFCNMYKEKYNDNFYLLSLTTYDPSIDISIIQNDIYNLKRFENEHLYFDYVYRRNDYDSELNNFAIISWDNIFDKYKIKPTIA